MMSTARTRLTSRWIGLGIFGLVMACAFIALGNWQLSRLEERRAENNVIAANQAAAVRPYQEVLTDPVEREEEYQRVSATGTYLPQQYRVRMRAINGVYGTEVVAILATTEGQHLVVDRGMVPRDGADPNVALPQLPTGQVSITGYVRRNEERVGNDGVPHDGHIRLIDSAALSQATGLKLVDGYITLISSDPAEGPPLQPVPAKARTEGNHLSYALQWFAFTVIGVVGLVVLIRGDLRDQRKTKAKQP